MSTASKIASFRQIVWDYYHDHRRDMPWRETTDPYKIVVSEVMLQQTQVASVTAKYHEWVQRFPDFETLAVAPVADVLQAWSGLGYNRRALNMHKLAQIVVRECGRKLPEQTSELIKLPGIGAGTAGSIAAFAFNAPVAFIETNVRRVFIHHFFEGREGVGDTELLPLVEQALDKENPREWYYALMDYGTYLTKTTTNPNRRSKHYVRQSKFEGSDRQVRGEILRQLLAGPKTKAELAELDMRADTLLLSLIKEGFVIYQTGKYRLA